MKVVEYSEEHREFLRPMLDSYFNEAVPNRREELKYDIYRCDEAINKLITSHSVYILVDSLDLPIAFMTCYINDEYGMVDKYLVCEYQYIMPHYRSGKAIALLTQALAELCVKLQLPIVNTTYVNASSNANVEKLGATPLATVSYISLEQATKIYKKYTRRIKK